MLLQPGTTLGPYSVTAKIGEGGMGEETEGTRALVLECRQAGADAQGDVR